MLASVTRPVTDNWLEDRIAEGRTRIFAEPAALTPALAAELLTRNPDNRSITPGRVAVYAADILEGHWQSNGEPIIISNDGLLNDGQHRCAAVAQTGIAIPVLIVFGVTRDSRKTTNQAKGKTAGDYLAMDRVPNANVTAGMTRLFLSWQATGNVNATSRISNAQILDFVEHNREEIAIAASFSGKHSKRLQHMISPSSFAFCYFICARKNKEAADQFFRSVATGENLPAGDPALVVRERLLMLHHSARVAKISIVLNGWNAFRRGETRTALRSSPILPELR